MRLCKLCWMVERDYLEMKGKLGLEPFEGRTWRGIYRHGTLFMVAHGFLSLRRGL
jgi:SRSO17 transposase